MSRPRDNFLRQSALQMVKWSHTKWIDWLVNDLHCELSVIKNYPVGHRIQYVHNTLFLRVCRLNGKCLFHSILSSHTLCYSKLIKYCMRFRAGPTTYTAVYFSKFRGLIAANKKGIEQWPPVPTINSRPAVLSSAQGLVIQHNYKTLI
jgi:hypothetical protein